MTGQPNVDSLYDSILKTYCDICMCNMIALPSKATHKAKLSSKVTKFVFRIGDIEIGYPENILPLMRFARDV